MKKYRLIEYDPTMESESCIASGSIAKVTDVMLAKQAVATEQCYYRIEEVDIAKELEESSEPFITACGHLPDKGATILPVFNWLNSTSKHKLYRSHIIALLKLETITAALNEGWKPDWEDLTQCKYYVFYSEDYKGCRINNCYFTSAIPSRLYFKSRELAEYAAMQFADLYKQLLIEKF